MEIVFGVIGILTICLMMSIWIHKLIEKGIHVWGKEYVKFEISKRFLRQRPKPPIHLMVMFTDHYEPQWRTTRIEIERQRVDDWVERYPVLASRHQDSDGRYPQHTWFFPIHEYREEHLQKLSGLCYNGFGEIEVHLHHNHDTSEGCEEKLNKCKELFSQHGGLITCEKDPRITYGFIHGMFALDNSSPKHCGVNDELQILKRTGCYADFTFPASRSECQSQKINSIYYAIDDPQKPKSYNNGIDVEKGGKATGDLMIIQGLLTINWRIWPKLLYPYLDTGIITHDNLPVKKRVDLWVRDGVYIKGKAEWKFVKVYSHGTQEKTRDMLLGEPMDRMHVYLREKYNDGNKYQLHYVTAREAYNIIKASEAGLEGNPNDYRDYLIKPPANTRILSNVLYQLQSYTEWSVVMKILEDKPVNLEFKNHVIEKIEGNIAEIDFKMEILENNLWVKINGIGKAKITFNSVKKIKDMENLSFLGNEGNKWRYLIDIDICKEKPMEMRYGLRE
ncbi:MAG: hypothetical protein ABH886_08360 [Candidatus Desantisbacteria bacterium]